MSETLIFRGVTLKHFDVRQGKEGADVFTRMYLSAEFSDTVREQMDWDDPGDCIKPGSPAKLTGELMAINFIITPGDKRLKDYELQLDIKDVSDFQVVTLKDDDGEPCGRQLRFVVRTPQDGAAGLAEQYIRRVGRHEGQLKISYEPQAKQLDLPGASNEVEKREVDGQEPIGEFLRGEALEEHQAKTGEAPLASVVTMGGSHQRGTRRNRPPRDREREAIADGSAEVEVSVQ